MGQPKQEIHTMALTKGHPIASDFAMSQYSPVLIRMTAEKLWLWLFWKNNLFDQVDVDGQPNTASNPKHPKTKSWWQWEIQLHLPLICFLTIEGNASDLTWTLNSPNMENPTWRSFFRRNRIWRQCDWRKVPERVPPPQSCMPIFPSLDKRRWCLPQGREVRDRQICCCLAPSYHVGNANPPAMNGQWASNDLWLTGAELPIWVLKISLALGSSWYRNASWQGPFAIPL